MGNILRLRKRESGKYVRPTLIIRFLILIPCIFSSIAVNADQVIALPNQANTCDSVSFWQLPNGQCVNLNNLSLLGVAQSKHTVNQSACWIANENAQPKTTTKPLSGSSAYPRNATLTVFPDNWEQKQRFAIQACSPSKETEIKLTQIESIVSDWFGEMSEQVGQAYRNHY